MHHALGDPYHPGSSPIHRLSPAVKLVLAVAFVLTVVALPRAAWPAYAFAGLALLVAALVSRVPLSRLGRRLLAVEPFALGVALLALLQPDGLRVFLAILTKSTLSLGAVVMLGATTPFSGVLRALSRFRVPPLLATALALLYRYLFVLVEEMGRMQRARLSRTFSPNRWFTWRSSATVIGHLFLRTSTRAERIYAAMRARGWKT
ncbi:MAG: cobalt ECF transporter T component CbiQ [Armatimonadota bacterium]|nr:cobalt ECF transporter T component CbiQ [Armatimonadota bacterium]